MQHHQDSHVKNLGASCSALRINVNLDDAPSANNNCPSTHTCWRSIDARETTRGVWVFLVLLGGGGGNRNWKYWVLGINGCSSGRTSFEDHLNASEDSPTLNWSTPTKKNKPAGDYLNFWNDNRPLEKTRRLQNQKKTKWRFWHGILTEAKISGKTLFLFLLFSFRTSQKSQPSSPEKQKQSFAEN